jgi:Membrane domain of glycerophosphoryl diester phosphodiesterase
MEGDMDAAELRPLALGELLDRTFRLYRNHFWLFVGIMAIPSAFSVPFTVIVFPMQASAIAGAKPTSAFAAGTVIFIVVFFCLFWGVYSMAIGAATYAVSESYLGQTVTVRSSYQKVRGKFWRILGVVVVAWLRAFGMLLLGGVGMAIIFGIIAGVMAAVGRVQPSRIVNVVIGVVFILAYLTGLVFWLLWSLRYAVSIPALLLESMGVRAALRRSVNLTRGRRWHVLIAIVLCTVIAYVGVIVFQGPALMTLMLSARGGQVPGWLGYVFALSGAIGGAITGPVLLIVLVLCYYDTRIRKEAFDLQFMMSSLDRPAAAPDTPSPA